MNFLFISPNFPESYWLFCHGLKQNNVNVYAISDAPYDSLNENLKNSLIEYYHVGNLQNYEEVYRACAFLIFKHGRMNIVESNNEFWLNLDAHLREDFNIKSGISLARLSEYQCKNKMKEFYHKVGIKTARYALATSFESAQAFIKLVNYPIVIKPNIGVGASHTYKIMNEHDLQSFFNSERKVAMIMEEFVDGLCFSFDGITNSKRELLFATSHQYSDSLMDVVNEQKSVGCYSYKQIPHDIMEAGLKTIEAFDVRSRFFHLEFFRLLYDQKGLGKKGDIVALEVNMRPPGGFIPDMMDYACDCNVYQIWADIIINDEIKNKQIRHYSSCFVGRRDHHNYELSLEQVEDKYKENIMMIKRLPQALASAMGDIIVVARFSSENESKEFIKSVEQEHIQ